MIEYEFVRQKHFGCWRRKGTLNVVQADREHGIEKVIAYAAAALDIRSLVQPAIGVA